MRKDGPGQVVTMRLSDQLFAIDAGRVREILDPPRITRVPNAPRLSNGLINVRGVVVPLVDFRVVFGMEQTPLGRDSRIVVIEVEIGGETTVVGLVADRVHDVTEIPVSGTAAPPEVGMCWPPEVIRLIGRLGDEFVVLPDLEAVFNLHAGAEGADQRKELSCA